jgi:hypothetical protein
VRIIEGDGDGKGGILEITDKDYQESLREHPRPGCECILNYGEAAAVLGVKVRDIRGLVAHGMIHDAAEYRFGLSKPLSATDVRRFGEGHVAISALARRFHLSSRCLAPYLGELGTPLQAIPLQD